MNALGAGQSLPYQAIPKPRASVFRLAAWAGIVLCIPLLQLGISFHLSGQSLALALIASQIRWRLTSRNILLPLLAFPMFFLKYLYFEGSNPVHAVLGTVIEYVCFLVLYFAFGGIQIHDNSKALVATLLRALLVVTPLLLLAQTYFNARGQYFTFPLAWFIANQDTLSGTEHALKYGTYLRPTGFYGEPSYMGAVVALVYFLYTKIEPGQRRKAEATILALGCVALLQSLTALLCFAAAFTLYARGWMRAAAVIALVASGAALIYLSDSSSNRFLSRIVSITSGQQDQSANGRLAVPAQVLGDTFKKGKILGITRDELTEHDLLGQINHGIVSVDNALLASAMWYGVLAIPLLGILCFRLSDWSLVFMLLMLMNANGSIFAYDKAFLFSLGLGLAKFEMNKRIKAPKTY